MGPPQGGRRGKQVQRKREKSSGGSSDKKQQRQRQNDENSDKYRKPYAPGGSNTELEKKGVERIPVELQQLLLNVFRFALWNPNVSPEPTSAPSLSESIQTLKDHLYRRDFESAFADANDKLLKAYALRWSAARALGYSEIFWQLRDILLPLDGSQSSVPSAESGAYKHIVSIGGGAGAEVVALAAIWRALDDQARAGHTGVRADEDVSSSLLRRTSELSVSKSQGEQGNFASESVQILGGGGENAPDGRNTPTDISVTAIDIADWSSILTNLTSSLSDASVPAKKRFPSPLVQQASYASEDGPFTVNFRNADVLTLSEGELKSHLLPLSQTRNADMVLVTLMFTLNELFSTSMSQTVRFLLRLTDIVQTGTVLLVVDSPGSYSTVSLGHSDTPSTRTAINSRSAQGEEKEEDEKSNSSSRKYPMRFLLEHTLLSVAAGKWDCILSDESRWFRRDKDALYYDLGDGFGLEDMRYQIHVYKKIA